MTMPFPVVKVRRDEFEQFLRASADVATLWKPDNIEFEQFLTRIPCNVEELMTAIELFAGQECNYVYVFNSNVDDPDGEWNQTVYDDNTLPEVKASELGEYVVQGSMGEDFLHFACSLEEACGPKYTTLLPGGREGCSTVQGYAWYAYPTSADASECPFVPNSDQNRHVNYYGPISTAKGLVNRARDGGYLCITSEELAPKILEGWEVESAELDSDFEAHDMGTICLVKEIKPQYPDMEPCQYELDVCD
jgi:hypothetical protein